MDKEMLNKKISEEDKAKLKYKEKLELLKQHYGIEFDITYFKNNEIDKIKFYDLEYKKSVKNISLTYDKKIGKFNYIFYEYESETSLKNTDDKKIISTLNKEKKLKLVIADINRLNNEYQLELKNINEKYDSKLEESGKELEINKKSKK